jgi:methylmalonyl-CoA mutase
MIEALKAGFPQNEISKTVQSRKDDLEKRKSVLIGTNKYANLKEPKPELSKTDYNKVFSESKKQLDEYYKNQDSKKIESLLSTLRNENVIDTGIEAIKNGATLGQIRKALNPNEKSKVESQKLDLHRAAEAFEKLRDSVEDFNNKTGARPKVFLINMGNVKQYKARADFATGFFEVGGFEIISPKGFESIDNAVETAVNSGAKTFVICSTDETYTELVPKITSGIKEILKDAVLVLAGYPKEQIEQHKKSGIDEFIYLGVNVYKVLSELLRKIGVVK